MNKIHRLIECEEKTSFEVKTKESEALKSYLLSHEDDIADGINDFYELRCVFKGLFLRDEVSDL